MDTGRLDSCMLLERNDLESGRFGFYLINVCSAIDASGLASTTS